MATIDHPCVKYHWGSREGVGFVRVGPLTVKYHQGVLVLDRADNDPMPWFDARMAGIEIVEIEDEARVLLQNAGYHLVGL